MMDAKGFLRAHKAVFIYLLITLAVATALFAYWLIAWRYKEYTDDAYVEGNQVYITPLHPGFVKAIHTDDTFLVKEGELLVELDETDAKIALDSAREALANTVRSVCQMVHSVFAFRSEIEMKKAEFIRSAQDYEHRENVIGAGGVSMEDFEHAIASLRSNYFSLQMTEILYDRALALVQNTSIQSHPQVLAAADKVRDAWVRLYRCKIYSPVEGLAAQRTIQVGMWIEAGAPLLSVIPLDQIWVNANYKETQLKRVRIGQRADVTVDLYGDDVVFHGTVVGLPGAAGNAFSILPPQNLTGNWIKIVQRLPVRIAFPIEELKAHPLRIGLSSEVRTYTKDTKGLMVPDSTKGSPLYKTPIFAKEEIGDEEFITKIIQENLDPQLSAFFTSPVTEEKILKSDKKDF